jgi:hypothetical protein
MIHLVIVCCVIQYDTKCKGMGRMAGPPPGPASFAPTPSFSGLSALIGRSRAPDLVRGILVLFPSSIRTHKGGAESGIVEGFISEDGSLSYKSPA